MQEFTAFEEDAFTTERRYVLMTVVLMDAEFAAIGRLPVGIEIHDHGVLPAVIAAKLIEVAAVETPLLIYRIVKFIARDTRVAGRIEMAHKSIHEIKEIIFGGIIV